MDTFLVLLIVWLAGWLASPGVVCALADNDDIQGNVMTCIAAGWAWPLFVVPFIAYRIFRLAAGTKR